MTEPRKRDALSLTTKLGLGFLFAAVLQVSQMLISSYFTAKMQSASLQVANGLTASMAVQAGLEAARDLEKRAANDAADTAKADPDVYRVYVDEVGTQARRITDLFAADRHPPFALACAMADALQKALAELEAGLQEQDPERRAESLAFFRDATRECEQALLQAQVRVRTLAEEGVRNEQAVHDLPVRAGLAITLGGVVLMAAFVVWFSRQLVIPIETAWAALEDVVDDRTAELAKTVGDLRNEIVERGRAEAQSRALHGQLVDASRRAGMAELANGVLHNVGNVLNNVNVSASVLLDRLEKSKSDGLRKAVNLIREHETDLATFLLQTKQGQKLPTYLDQLAEHMLRERDTLIAETKDLSAQIDHMKEIVSRQQSYARVSGALSRGRPSQIVDDVIAVQEPSFRKHDIRVEKRIDHDPECDVDRSRVMQVLLNLLSNAKHSLCEHDRGGAVCEIAVVDGGDDRFRIVVTDNGVGIPPANLTRIFGHGFTTRKDGHGFGLHHSANAATEMGGRLWAESEGEGKGARFVLELPIRAPAGASQ
ncbi:MAG: hypothetical protein JNK78_18970 [Planctomycetes bacterium]|nr:hypothetical protein [Planctomycetota bacterium]